MSRYRLMAVLTAIALLSVLPVGSMRAQESDATPEGGPPFTDMFTYQGYLEESGAPANGRYDFDITIWTAETGGTEVGDCTTLALSDVSVEDGVYTFLLYPDQPMSTVFDGAGRWLQVKVRRHGIPAWTTLPRQPITATPYAWGLRPGAAIQGAYAGTLLKLTNTYTAATDKGSAIRAESAAPTVPTIHGEHKGDGPAVYGYTAGAYPAVEGMHGGSGPAVAGYNLSTGTGVYGSTSADAWPGKAGVYGRSEGRSPGVHGANVSETDQSPGVHGTSILGAGGDFRGAAAGLYARSTAVGAGYAAGLYNDTSTPNSQYMATLWLFNNGSGDLIWAAGGGGELDFRVTENGAVYADGGYYVGAGDFAEMLAAAGRTEPGDVLAIGKDGRLIRNATAFAVDVAGEYSTQPGFVGGAHEEGVAADEAPLAMVGVVPVKASAENGPINPGDLLVGAATPGHAMAAGSAPPQGAVIGKALETLQEGAGVIRMLVSLQ